MQGLRQASKYIKWYIEEFYRVIIRIRHSKVNKEKVAHYINALKPSIQEELSLVRMAIIEDAYQFSLKIEENLNRRFESNQRGRGHGGRTGGRSYGGRNEDQKKNEEFGSNQNQRG